MKPTPIPKKIAVPLLFACVLALGGCPAMDSYDPAPGGEKMSLRDALNECNVHTDQNPDAPDVRKIHDQCMLERGWQLNL